MQYLTPSEVNETIQKLCRFHPIGVNHQVNQLSFSQSFIQRFCKTLSRVLQSESALIHIQAPVSVCGDIHGDFLSLLRIFHTQQLPSETNKYLFLGDYVDRGNNSLEVVILLGLLKIQQPACIFMLAGNHESASIQGDYGFWKECEAQLQPPEFAKGGWALINRVFTQFPICAIINDRIFCTHGGISPELLEPNASLDLINHLNREDLFDMEHPGLLCDLLWADPDDSIHGFGNNERGVR
jgi:serine/threonine-protein phosphatase PP1 catalytic subunit